MLHTFSDTLTANDVKRHIRHQFDLPSGCQRLTIRLTFEPAAVDGIRNMLTLTIFDPNGFRGAGHRGGNEHLVEIDSGSATPGYAPGPLPTGPWIVQIDTHMILPGEPCRYRSEYLRRTRNLTPLRPAGPLLLYPASPTSPIPTPAGIAAISTPTRSTPTPAGTCPIWWTLRVPSAWISSR